MYQSNTIRQCLWLIATIRQNGRLTLKALQEKWTADKMGDTLHRSSFNRYRDKIFELFGLVMECDEKYQYYFQNPGELTDHSIESWLLSTMTVNVAGDYSTASWMGNTFIIVNNTVSGWYNGSGTGNPAFSSLGTLTSLSIGGEAQTYGDSSPEDHTVEMLYRVYASGGSAPAWSGRRIRSALASIITHFLQ